MLRAERRPVECEQAPTFQDAIDDGMREVFIVQDSAPRRHGFVRREDHRALPAMAVVDDVKEHVRGVGAIGEIPDLIDDEDIRMRVRRERVREPTSPERR